MGLIPIRFRIRIRILMRLRLRLWLQNGGGPLLATVGQKVNCKHDPVCRAALPIPPFALPPCTLHLLLILACLQVTHSTAGALSGDGNRRQWVQCIPASQQPCIRATLHPCSPAPPNATLQPPNEECRSLYYATLASAAGCCLKRIFVMLHCAARSCYCCCSSALSPKSFWLHLSNGSNALKYAKARKMFIISAVQTRAEDNGVEAEECTVKSSNKKFK